MVIHITDPQKWLILVGIIILWWFISELTPILFPFLTAIILAYLGTPLVDLMTYRRISRSVAVLLVFLMFLLLFTVLIIVFLPILERQLDSLIMRLPTWSERVQKYIMPHILYALGLEEGISNLETFQMAIIQNWQQAGGLVATVLKYVTASGIRLTIWISNLILIPMLLFYLLIDWYVFLGHLNLLIPRRFEEKTITILKECDAILAQFLRGQLLVMCILGVIYSVGLWLIGLDFALLFGLSAGLISFVPYLGFIVGIVAAGIAALMQFGDILHLILVSVVFGVGQLLESFLLTPYLVGNKIGLHPVAVIFALMAGGQLLGFVGILIALPVAAVLLVLLRHVRQHYLLSRLYN